MKDDKKHRPVTRRDRKRFVASLQRDPCDRSTIDGDRRCR
jgi:hypothetical protein